MNNYKLGELIEITSSKRIHAEDYVESGIPFYRSKEIIQLSKGENITEILHISLEQYSKIKSRFPLPKNGDILLTSVGTIGIPYYVRDENFYFKDGNLTWFRNFSEKINSKYLLFWMQSNFFKSQINNNNIGAVQKALTIDFLKKFNIQLPSLKTQGKITSILTSIVAKIELNNRINAELEAMSKTLYDYWFVQFDFPDADGKPYKTSGGRMVWNAELKREIPEGWEVKKTDDLVADIKTGLNPREHFKLGGGLNYYITIKNIEYGRISFDDSCDRIDDQAKERIQKRSNLEKGDILFTSIEPVGKTYLLSENPVNWNINESVFSFKPNYNLVSSEYLFMLLSSKEFNNLCKNASTGSIHKGIRITPMKAFKLCYPNNKDLINEFTKIVSPYLKLIDKNQKENQELSSLRDWLLPMLMNGQVSVGEVEEELRMVAEGNVEYKRS